MIHKVLITMLLVVSGSATSAPTIQDLDLCYQIYTSCIEQQKAGRVKASCVTYESDNPELKKLLKMGDDGVLSTQLNLDANLWQRSYQSCYQMRLIFKMKESNANIPDKAFKSGVNPDKYIVVD